MRRAAAVEISASDTSEDTCTSYAGTGVGNCRAGAVRPAVQRGRPLGRALSENFQAEIFWKAEH